MLNHTDLKAERTALLARIEEMHATLVECDWCCGGGDQEMEAITDRLAEIEADLSPPWPEDDYAEGGRCSKRDQDRGYVTGR
jgi:predicted trehalose synthase